MFRKSPKRFVAFTIIIVCILEAVIILSSIYYGMILHRQGAGRSASEIFSGLISSRFATIGNYLKGLTSRPEHIQIDIKHIDFQKLAFKRQEALRMGILVVTDSDYVPATITFGDKKVRAKIRLKGDWLEHLTGEHWSFRVQIRGENTLFGMKQFSLQKPFTRDYINEWIYHQALKREDIISLRYDFLTVTINGKDMGVYAIEEHFEKRLVESNMRREGPIVRFEEDLFWTPNAWKDFTTRDQEAYLTSNIDIFQTSKYLRDTMLLDESLRAMALLDAFRKGEMTTSEVFDAPRLACFMALSDLLGAFHGIRWHNRRFYYNPVTCKLEPIGFDSGSGVSIMNIFYTERNPHLINSIYRERLFADTAFLSLYMGELERFSSPEYVDSLMAGLKDGFHQKLAVLYREFPYYHFDPGFLYNNQKVIRQYLHPVRAVQAYVNRIDNDRVLIDIANIQSLPVYILGLEYHNSLRFSPGKEIYLAPVKFDLTADFETVEFTADYSGPLPDSLRDSLVIHYNIPGCSQVLSESVFSYSFQNPDILKEDITRIPANHNNFNFVYTDDSTKTINILPGKWRISEDIIFPPGYKIMCQPGTALDLMDSSMIMSRSPVDFLGSAEFPIEIKSSDHSGQGLVVMANNEKSRLVNTFFSGLRYPSRPYWSLTGAVTFYESPVGISACAFTDNDSEDALNIIRSEFDINGTVFANIKSDAFDSDFCHGTLSDCRFSHSGNDGLDVSGSIVNVSGIEIEFAGDKGISTGENSLLSGENIDIKNSNIGVASKDLSRVRLSGVYIGNCGIGISAYQKKPEFGPGYAEFSGCRLVNNVHDFVIEENSTVFYNENGIAPNISDMDSVLTADSSD